MMMNPQQVGGNKQHATLVVRNQINIINNNQSQQIFSKGNFAGSSNEYLNSEENIKNTQSIDNLNVRVPDNNNVLASAQTNISNKNKKFLMNSNNNT